MPPPATVKAWLLNMATNDVVDGDVMNTPNKLLYMPCFWGTYMSVEFLRALGSQTW